MRRVLRSAEGTILRPGPGGCFFAVVPPAETGFGTITVTATGPTSARATIAWHGNAGTIRWRFTASPEGKTKADVTNALAVGGAGTYEAATASLSPATTYAFLCWYDSGSGTLVPAGPTDLQAGDNTITTPAGIAAPTAVTPTGVAVSETSGAGAQIATLVANAPDCTFSEVSDPSGLFAVSATGVLSTSASLAGQAGSKSYTVRATNSAGTHDQAVTINVQAASSSGLVPDVTVGSIPALLSQLNAWASSMSGPKVVGLTAGTYSDNLTFKNKSLAHPVTIRAVGTFTDTNGPVNVTGVWDFGGTHKVRFYGLRFRNDTRLRIDGANDITISRCWFRGADVADPAASAFTSFRGLLLSSNQRLVIEDCYFEQFQVCGATVGSGTDITIRRCVTNWTSHDCWKGTGTVTRFRLLDCWGSRQRNLVASNTHPDFLQWQGGGLDQAWFRGNVLMRGTPWPRYEVVNQGIFIGGDTNNVNNTNAVAEQNIVVSNAGNGIYGYKNGNSAGSVARDNLTLHVLRAGRADLMWGDSPFVTKWQGGVYRNVVGRYTGVTHTDGGAGAGGEAISIGVKGAPSTAAFEARYTRYPDLASMFGDLLPLAGQPTHWDAATTRGPAARLREIFVEGKHPGNVGWPVAKPWTTAYNADGAVASTYTGSYDVDGANA